MNKNYDAIIIGAGISGLIAARHLEEYNLNVLVLEKDDRAGGRIKTDVVDGFRLDHGFQLLLTAYPEARKQLDYEALNLCYLKAGAICFDEDQHFKIYSNKDTKLASLRNIFSPVGTLMDKVRLGNLRAHLNSLSVEQIFELPNSSTYNYLKQKYFSNKIIDRFFKPFFGSLFHENRLDTSSRMFLFMFKMFAEGYAAIPERGMEEIPKHLKSQLKRTEFRFHTEVAKVLNGKVILKNGEEIESDKIIIATNPDPIIPRLKTVGKWRDTANYYFSADESILKKNILALNYSKRKLVNNFAVMSDISPAYAPEGKHLISVSINNIPEMSVEDVSKNIKKELGRTFGKEVANWKYLQSYHISQAIPVPQNVQYEVPFTETRLREGVYLAGDQMLHGSINAAIKSGELAARAVILDT